MAQWVKVLVPGLMTWAGSPEFTGHRERTHAHSFPLHVSVARAPKLQKTLYLSPSCYPICYCFISSLLFAISFFKKKNEEIEIRTLTLLLMKLTGEHAVRYLLKSLVKVNFQ